jgi:orotate phosphoribosyltransferase
LSTDNLNVEQLLREAGAIKQGHFLLTSGLHSNLYLEKFQVLQYPRYTDLLCSAFAAHFKDEQISVVAGPTMGGVLLAYATARFLGEDVRGIFAERASGDELAKMGERVFRRGFVISPGERVLIVDDILTTGLSLREILAAVERLDGEIVGIGVIVDRSQGRANFGYPLYSLAQIDIPTWRPDECPMCQDGVTLVKPGSS